MDVQSTGALSRSMPVKALLGDLERLYDLARDKADASRELLAEEISKLMLVEVQPRESELIADVLIELIEQAKKDLRLALSQKIAHIDSAPLRLVLHLANDELDVAEPILRHSNCLDSFDLMYIIKSNTAEYWQVIAERKNLSNEVIELLARSDDFNTALSLVENTHITLNDNALTSLSDFARGYDDLALPLLRREEVSAELAHAMFEYVGEMVKAYINEHFSDADLQEATQIVNDTVAEMQFHDQNADKKSSVFKEFEPEEHMLDMALSYKKKGLLNIQIMMETLRQSRVRSFVALFSVYTEISPDIIGQVLSQTNGKSLSIICRAHGMEKQDFISIFMMTGKVWNNGELVKMDQIKGALQYFNTMTRDKAQEIVEKKIRI